MTPTSASTLNHRAHGRGLEMPRHDIGRNVHHRARSVHARLGVRQSLGGYVGAEYLRLPPEPLVVKPVESVGKYGGTWYRWNDHPRMFCWEPLVKMNVDGSLHPNVATSWEISPDYTKFTFHIRKGIKWSDGQPCTTADVKFWYEDVLLAGTAPAWLMVPYSWAAFIAAYLLSSNLPLATIPLAALGWRLAAQKRGKLAE